MSKGAYDLLVCIRCHANLAFVLDTEQSVRYNTNPSYTKIVFAVDGGLTGTFAKKLINIVGRERVYVSKTHWNWGPGLFCLLVESIKHFRKIYKFNHFQTIDYDTLYLGPGADLAILDRIIAPDIGLLGCYRKHNEHWRKMFNKAKKTFIKTFGEPPKAYTPGEGCQGGYMTLTKSLLERMEQRGMFEKPYSVAKRYTSIADDHLLPIFVRMCQLRIVNVSRFACCHWNARDDPRGMEKHGVLVFHPTKLSAHNKSRSTEVLIRNYFREKRKAPDLLR